MTRTKKRADIRGRQRCSKSFNNEDCNTLREIKHSAKQLVEKVGNLKQRVLEVDYCIQIAKAQEKTTAKTTVNIYSCKINDLEERLQTKKDDLFTGSKIRL